MAEEKITIDLRTVGKAIQKEANGLEKSVFKVVKVVEKGFASLVVSGRALNNTLANMSGAAERTLASFDELDRLGSDQSAEKPEAEQKVTVTVEGATIEVDANQIVQQIQQTINSTQGPVINANLAIDISSVTEDVTNLGLTIESLFDDLLSLDFTPLVVGLLNVMVVAVPLGAILTGTLEALSGNTLSLDFSAPVTGILNAVAAVTLLVGALGSVSISAGDIVGGMTVFFSGLITAIGGVVTYLAGGFTELWTSIWQGIVTIVTTIIGTIGGIIQNNLNSLVEFITFLAELFSGLWTGVQTLWGAVATWFYDTVIAPAVEFFTGLWTSVLGIFTNLWTDIQALWGIVSGWYYDNVITPIVEHFVGLWTDVSEIFTNLWTGIQALWGVVATWFYDTVIAPVVGYFSGLWEDIKIGVQETWDKIAEVFQGVAEWFDTNLIQPVTKGFRSFINSLISGVESFVNFFIRGINCIIGGFNKLSINIPDNPITGAVHVGFNIPKIPELTLPRLATGAVIPPNREFMAVLGDQKRGTNIETPEGLLRQIFREESGNGAVVSELREILSAIREGKVMMVDRREIGVIVQDALSSTTRSGMATMPVR